MSVEEFIREAERHARPCLVLTAEAGEDPPVGAWRAGRLPDRLGERPEHHLVTVDCGWLARSGAPVGGALHVFLSEDPDDPACGEVRPVLDPEGADLETLGGTQLRGQQHVSLPAFEELSGSGSPDVQAFFEGAATRPEFRRIREAYGRIWWERHPWIQDERTVAVMGGWGFVWDWAGDRLLLQTFLGAEPWYEVWLDEGKLVGNVRCT